MINGINKYRCHFPVGWVERSETQRKLNLFVGLRFLTQLTNQDIFDLGEGINFLPELLKAAIVAINQLPVTEDTLWLRVLGKGRTQTEAIKEVVKLSNGDEKWDKLVEMFASWRKNLELNSSVNDEEVKELIMSLSPAYLKQQEAWKQEGIEEGRQEGQVDGQRLMIESLLAVRFGNLDEELSSIANQMMELSLNERTQFLLNLSNISREELLAKFKID